MQKENISSIRIQMKELVSELNAASDAYYNSGQTLMSDHEFDRKMEELQKMEEETGIILDNSPLHNVGAKKRDGSKKIQHEYPALSLDKTKDMDQFVGKFEKAACEDKSVVLMWKMDGSTVQLTYDNGKLTTAATRGDGEVGQDITPNAKFINGIPLTIPHKGHLVVRGEAVMHYDVFDRLNEALEDGAKYANPRNLANATISMLDPNEVKKRPVEFYAFNLVYGDNFGNGYPAPVETLLMDGLDFASRMITMQNLGFQCVYWERAQLDQLSERMRFMESLAADGKIPFPVDGLVAALNDAAYADKLSGTGHHPSVLRGYAFKWHDEAKETTLRDVEWQASRTGLLNPVAVFDPIELYGTTVSKATLHNVSFMRNLGLKRGDRIEVTKANMIIPEVVKNNDFTELNEDHTDDITKNDLYPKRCPICGLKVTLVEGQDGSSTLTMRCENPDCSAKRIGAFVHFCERDCMDIQGLSEATIKKFVDAEFLNEFADFYHLDQYKEEIVKMEGFGQKSWDRLWDSIEASRETSFIPFIHALGIPLVGKGQAKLLYRYFTNNEENEGRDYLNNLIGGLTREEDFTFIDGIGPMIQKSLETWAEKEIDWADPETTEFGNLLKELKFKEPEAKEETDQTLAGKTFVITGKVNVYKNRDEFKASVEARGGKVAGSVSKNTDFLVNNDLESTTGKNKKAKELNVPIISEEEFIAKFGK